MIKYLLIDLDDTILDFKKAEGIALCKTLESFHIPPTQQVRDLYGRINQAHWEMLERGEITRAQVLHGRFATLLRELQVSADPDELNKAYMRNLSQGHYFLPGAEEALKSLHKKYQLYIASNGTVSVQKGRLQSANIRGYFQDIFISQELGANKPSVHFFENAFSRIPGFQKENAMIVGDSLTSDVLGGIRAGISTCWVNPFHKPGREDICPDHEIESLAQLENLLERI